MRKLIRKISYWYFSKNALPYWCVLTFDCLVVIASGVFSYALNHGAENTIPVFNALIETLCIYLVFFMIGFRIMHTYFGVMRYTSFTDIHRVAIANFIGVCIIAFMRYFMNFDHIFLAIRMRDLALTFILATTIMWSTRMLVKYLYEYYKTDQDARRVFIYGVKNGGVSLARSILDSPSFHLKGFVSDADDMVGKYLMGVNVIKNDEHLVDIMQHEDVNTLLVSPLKQKAFINNQEMLDKLIEAGITIYIVNQAVEWDEKSAIPTSQLREFEIEDLLPRDEIQVDMQSMEAQIANYNIMVTGAAGSIGSELVKQIAKLKPASLILIDQAETPMHDMRLMMQKEWPQIEAHTIVTSICNKKRMEAIFKKLKPDYVFHAAAYKHVPMMEDNPSESVHNNVYGTKVIADLSVKYYVKKFVMISTDKAVNPTNVMGCSKRICEIYVQSLDKAIKDGLVLGITQFVTTRFGNVLGSNGSVIPLFKEQIKNGGPVTVTDPNIIRYFMLISEACKLVLEAGTKGKGGEIFVFDMGKPVKIADLAMRMIKLSNAKNVEIVYTGLRPGEKLYEEVLNQAETTKPSFHEKIRIANVREYNYNDVCCDIDNLITISQRFDDMKTVQKMKEIVPEYKSKNSIYEQLDQTS